MDERTCWVCFGTDRDAKAEWVSPCRCSGTLKWVHQTCLRRWINESHNVDVSRCPQCKTRYTILEPTTSLIVALGDKVDQFVSKAAPVAGVMLIATSVWAGLGIYGITTFVHVCGKDGNAILGTISPLKLFFVMPALPLALVLVRVQVAVRLRTNATRTEEDAAGGQPEGQGEEISEYEDDEEDEEDWISVESENEDGARQEDDEDAIELELPNIDGPISISRIVVGGLLLPYIASAVGRLLVPFAMHPLDRTLLGGTLFLAVKGALKHFYHSQKSVIMAHRRVLDFAP